MPSEKLMELAILNSQFIAFFLISFLVLEIALRFVFKIKERFYLNAAVNLFLCMSLGCLLVVLLNSVMNVQNFFVIAITTIQLFKFCRDLLNETLDRLLK